MFVIKSRFSGAWLNGDLLKFKTFRRIGGRVIIMKFEQYRRTQIAEMRPISYVEISQFNRYGFVIVGTTGSSKTMLSISVSDRRNGSPKIGDMIARNPKNHSDQWLVAEQYFKDNFEEIN